MRLFAIIFTVVFVCACSGLPLTPLGRSSRSQVEKAEDEIRVIAIELNHRLRHFDPASKTIVITTFVNLDNLDTTSSFGRFIAEQLSDELHKLGYNIRELRLRKTIEVQNEKGEFTLTRNSADLMKRAQIDAALAGAYMVIGDEVVVNARIIDLDSARVISVGHMVADLKGMERIQDLLSRRPLGSTPVVRVVSPDNS